MTIQGERINNEMRDNEVKDNRLRKTNILAIASKSLHIINTEVTEAEQLRIHKERSIYSVVPS